MADTDYRLPGPAEIVAACREWDAGRRRWPDARCSDGPSPPATGTPNGQDISHQTRQDAGTAAAAYRWVPAPRRATVVENLAGRVAAADLVHLAVLVAVVLGVLGLGFCLGRWLR